jgi:hypothetical protein
MNIGIPKEIKAQEARVSMIPGNVAELVKRGHTVRVERGAGEGASYPDALYEAAGAVMAETAAEVFGESEMIVKVKEPQPVEVAMLGRGQVLFTYLHLAANKGLTEGLMASGCVAIAYETIEVNRRLPLLEPMSEIAGRMSAIVGSYHLANHRGGRGCLLGGVPGVAPGRVVVLGGAGWWDGWCECGAGGDGDRCGCYDSGGGFRADAVFGHHDGIGAHGVFERGESIRFAAACGSGDRGGVGARGACAEVDHAGDVADDA